MSATSDMSTASRAEPISSKGRLPLRGLLINRNFALLFFGQAISLLGDQIIGMILIVWIASQLAAHQSWGPLATSGLNIIIILPVLLIGPLAGVFIDRWQHRRTMMTMDLLRTGVIGALFVLPLVQSFISPLLTLIIIFVAIFFETTCAQFFNPARFALLADIVPDEKRAQATGLEQTSQSISMIIGPAIAAPLLFSIGTQWAILADALTFLVSFLAIRAVRMSSRTEAVQVATTEKTDDASSITHAESAEAVGGSHVEQKKSVLADLGSGLRFAFGNRTIRVLIISIFLLTMSVSTFSPLAVFFVQQNLHTSASNSGILLSFMGAGAILGAILFGMLGQRIGVKRLFVSSILLVGVIFVLFSRLNNFLLACPVILVAGMLQAGLNVAAIPLVMQETPKQLMGRITSIMGPIVMFGSLLSIICAGFISGVLLAHLHLNLLGMTFGPIDTVFTFAGLIVILGGCFAAFSLPGKQKTRLTAEAASPAS